MHRSLSLLIVLLTGCASVASTRPATIPQPEIDARLAHPVFFGSGSTAPATVDVTVRNRAKVPIVVRRVEVDTPGMVMYTILRTSRTFRETVPAGETKSLPIFATATTVTSRPTEPLAIRVIIEFEGGGSIWREVLITRGEAP